MRSSKRQSFRGVLVREVENCLNEVASGLESEPRQEPADEGADDGSPHEGGEGLRGKPA